MKLKKDITFIYSDAAEKAIMKPIYIEAKKRGYEVSMTSDKFVRAEIGVYCQHKNFPQYSKFSVIMFHDIIQAYSRWPDIWFIEPWNKYDIGILPGNRWVKNWNACSNLFYARPRRGVYKVGWPKADIVASIDREQYRNEFNAKYGLSDDKKTVLYAPSWENDNKEDDFVRAMLKLNVNILIKQPPCSEEAYPQLYKNIKEQYEKHKDIAGVTILDNSENIFKAIGASDILVSEESSTMCEAVMMGLPAVSVCDWLIPDVVPSRYPKSDYDFVEKTEKAKLTECVKNILDNYSYYAKKSEDYSKANYSNIGSASAIFMDIIDHFTMGGTADIKPLKPKKKASVPVKKRLMFYGVCIKRELTENYFKRYALLNKLYNIYRKLMHKQKVSLIKREG